MACFTYVLRTLFWTFLCTVCLIRGAHHRLHKDDKTTTKQPPHVDLQDTSTSDTPVIPTDSSLSEADNSTTEYDNSSVTWLSTTEDNSTEIWTTTTDGNSTEQLITTTDDNITDTRWTTDSNITEPWWNVTTDSPFNTTTLDPEIDQVDLCNDTCLVNNCSCCQYPGNTICEDVDVTPFAIVTQIEEIEPYYIEKNKVKLTCHAYMLFPEENNATLHDENVTDITVTLMWQVGDTIITNEDSSRRFHYVSTHEGNYTWKSDLFIHPVEFRDSGNVSCLPVIRCKNRISTNCSYSGELNVESRPWPRVYPRPAVYRQVTQTTMFECTAYNTIGELLDDTYFNWIDISHDLGFNSTSEDGTVPENKFSQINVWVKDTVDAEPGTTLEYNINCNATRRANAELQISSIRVNTVKLFIIFPDPDGPEICFCKGSSLNLKYDYPENATYEFMCKEGQNGYQKITCEKYGNSCGWGFIDDTDCVDEEYKDIIEDIDDIIDSGATSGDATRILNEMIQLTNDPLSPGNMKACVKSISKLADARDETSTSDPVTLDEIQEAVSFSGNVLDDQNFECWSNISRVEDNTTTITTVLQTVDTYSKARVKGENGETDQVVPDKNLGVHLRKVNINQGQEISICTKDVFMDSGVTFTSENDSVVLTNITDLQEGSLSAFCVIYRTMHILLPNRSSTNATDLISNATKVLSLTFTEDSLQYWDPPIELSFAYINESELKAEEGKMYVPSCEYWDESEGRWNESGCYVNVNRSNEWFTVCSCNHTTSFGVIMRPVKRPPNIVLSVISQIGCIVSVCGMMVTIAVYAIFWKYLKSHHAVLVVNLCVALSIANIWFIAGIQRTELSDLCVAITAFLHYFFLTSMCIMLAEGIQIYVFLVHVFHVKRYRNTYFLVAVAWTVPAVIVGITIGVVGKKDYVSSDHCWLNIEGFVIMSFMGPVAVIVVVNFVILIVAIRRAYKSADRLNKSKEEKLWNAVRNALVLTPLLGVTWLLGLFVFSSIVLEYMFTILNSLQGFFIFLFHCVFNSKVRHIVTSKDLTSKTINTSRRNSKTKSTTSGTGTPNGSIKTQSSNGSGSNQEQEFTEMYARMYGGSINIHRGSARDVYRTFTTLHGVDDSGIDSYESGNDKTPSDSASQDSNSDGGDSEYRHPHDTRASDAFANIGPGSSVVVGYDGYHRWVDGGTVSEYNTTHPSQLFF